MEHQGREMKQELPIKTIESLHDGKCIWCGEKRDIHTCRIYGYKNKFLAFCLECDEILKGMMKK